MSGKSHSSLWHSDNNKACFKKFCSFQRFAEMVLHLVEKYKNYTVYKRTKRFAEMVELADTHV